MSHLLIPALLSFLSAYDGKSPATPTREGLSRLPYYSPATHNKDFCLSLCLSSVRWACNSKRWRIQRPAHSPYVNISPASACGVCWGGCCSRASLACQLRSLVALLGMAVQDKKRIQGLFSSSGPAQSGFHLSVSLAGRSRSLILVKEQSCHFCQSGEGGRYDPVSGCITFWTFSARFVQCL